MQVGLFAHRLSQRHPTGIARYTRELVCALGALEDGTTRFIVASTREPDAADWVPETIELRVVSWPRRPVQAAWTLGLGPRLERGMGRLDALHLIQPFPPAKSLAPQLVTVHDLFPLEYSDWYPRSQQWTYRRSMALMVRRAVRIVVPSEFVGRRLQELLDIAPERIAVVPLGVSGVFASAGGEQAIEASCARHGVSPGQYAVCVGQISTRKNLIPLVQALAQLPAAERVPLLLIGPEGHGSDRVDAEIAKLDGGAQVRRTGFLPDADAAALVAGAAVLVHPALGEGFGFVPLEAMAARTPVIAAAVSSIPEVTADAALLVDTPADPEAWAGALVELLRDRQQRAAMAVAGQQRAAGFSWKRSAERLLEIYADVASS